MDCVFDCAHTFGFCEAFVSRVGFERKSSLSQVGLHCTAGILRTLLCLENGTLKTVRS